LPQDQLSLRAISATDHAAASLAKQVADFVLSPFLAAARLSAVRGIALAYKPTLTKMRGLYARCPDSVLKSADAASSLKWAANTITFSPASAILVAVLMPFSHPA